MANLNRVLVQKGYAPLTQVAQATSKHRTTVYRMVQAGKLSAIEDGHSTYVELKSLLTMYAEQNNKPMVEAIHKLGARLLREVAAAEKRDEKQAG